MTFDVDLYTQIAITKHLMGMHDQDKHAEKGKQKPKSSEKGKGFQRDGELSYSEIAAIGGVLGTVVFGASMLKKRSVFKKAIGGTGDQIGGPWADSGVGRKRFYEATETVSKKEGSIFEPLRGVERGSAQQMTKGSLAESLAHVEKEMLSSTTGNEYSIIFDSDGKALTGFFEGASGTTVPVDTYDPAKVMSYQKKFLTGGFAGGTFTHNHPAGIGKDGVDIVGGSLSPPDLLVWSNGGLSRIRAATPEGIYEMRWKPDAPWPPPSNLAHDIQRMNTGTRALDLYAAHGGMGMRSDMLPIPEVKSRAAIGDVHHTVNTKLADRYSNWIEYEFIPHPDTPTSYRPKMLDGLELKEATAGGNSDFDPMLSTVSYIQDWGYYGGMGAGGAAGLKYMLTPPKKDD